MFFRNRTTVFVIVVALFVVGWAIYNSTKLTDPNQIMTSWILAAFTVMITPLLMIMKVNDIVRKETKERKESTDTIEVTKAKITRSIDLVEGKTVIGWNQIEVICETKEYIYIYLAANQGVFIVKADIIEGSVALFRKLANNNMKKNKKGKVQYKMYFKEQKNEK
jgi:phosphate/sulfate permease